MNELRLVSFSIMRQKKKKTAEENKEKKCIISYRFL